MRKAIFLFILFLTLSATAQENYMEKANYYYSKLNYEQAFEYYFLELEARPNQYNIIKSRLQNLLLYDVNKSIADELRIALLKKTHEKPENEQFAMLLMWFALQQEDYDIALEQCKSLDRRLDNQDAQLITLAHICFDNAQYELAKDAYEYLITKGKINPFYGDAMVGAVKTESQLCKINHIEDKATYERLSRRIEDAYSEIGSKEYPNLVEIQADIMAYHLDQAPQAIELLQKVIGQTSNKIQQNLEPGSPGLTVERSPQPGHMLPRCFAVCPFPVAGASGELRG